jgi:hypothetical protein
MSLGPEHYSARASDLEAAAEQIGDRNISARYLKLAQSFRELADLTGAPQKQIDAEVQALAERMVGKARRVR